MNNLGRLAMYIRSFGAVDVFFEERNYPLADLGEDELLVRVEYIGLNPLDWKTRKGLGWAAAQIKSFPALLGYEFAGVVLRSNSCDFAAGDRVCGAADGCYCTDLVVKAKNLARIPANLASDVAAVLPIAGLTAQQIMHKAGFKQGEKVLFNAPCGGVGHFLLQMLRGAGIDFSVISSAKYRQELRELGAKDFFAYDEDGADYGKCNADVLIDLVGSDDFSLLDGLKDGGRIIVVPTIAVEKMQKAVVNLKRDLAVSGILVEQSRAQLELLLEDLASGRLRSEISKKYHLSELAAAHRELEQGHTRGKIVLYTE